MKEKTKMFICMTIFLSLAFIEIMFKLDLLGGWMLLFMLGFGWYSRGAIIEKNFVSSVKEVKA